MKSDNVWGGIDGKYHVPQPAWMWSLKVGDVIAERNGPWRVVREVTRRRDGRLYSIALVIRRCSWTHRCYTLLNAHDLRARGFRKIPVRALSLKKRGIDAQILREIHAGSQPPKLSCCDVKDIP